MSPDEGGEWGSSDERRAGGGGAESWWCLPRLAEEGRALGVRQGVVVRRGGWHVRVVHGRVVMVRIDIHYGWCIKDPRPGLAGNFVCEHVSTLFSPPLPGGVGRQCDEA